MSRGDAAHGTRRAVAIGGGHGLARSLAALAAVVDDVTAVVTVADDGGSSGRLRRDLGVLPPGDLRMAAATLARHRELADLLQYRFDRGELRGHSLGNLVLVALQDLVGGDVQEALDRIGQLLDIPGRVVPCTTDPVTLHASTALSTVSGQAAVASTAGLRRVWLEPAAPAASGAALEALAAADLIVLGPGSLFTSLLPNLLVPDLAAAIGRSSAPTVLVTNLREQPGETERMSLEDHLDALRTHVPGLRIDVCVSHAGARPSGGGAPLWVDPAVLAGRVDRSVVADLLDGADGHDPAALAAVFADLLPR